jgi:LPXTG-motif cell wall-anchored protein
MPVTRKRKIEVARLAGFGLVLAGLFALFLAVVSSQGAGATKPSPRVVVLHCTYTGDTTGGGIGEAVQYGACETTTTLEGQGPTTTSAAHHCGCTSTTTYVTTTTEHHRCGCTTTTTSGTLPTSSSTSSTSSTTTSTSTTTTSTTTTTLGGQGGPISTVTTAKAGGSPVTGGGAPVSQAQAVSGQLPFTGSSSLTLAGFGVLMLATGGALSLRRRRLSS